MAKKARKKTATARKKKPAAMANDEGSRGDGVINEAGHPPALVNYLERIGAEVLSFRRAMVKEHAKGDNYYIERTLIKIGVGGVIECSRKEHEPTSAEEKEIAAEFTRTKFPKSIGATKAGLERWLEGQKGDKGRFFALWNRQDGLIRMVQERIETDSGKLFIPHSLWDDGVWRRMEPDGALPFWKPEKRSRLARIMIHEGCKAARFMHELTTSLERRDELRAHPWRDVICQYESWGMIGGALAPHRTNYDELRRERPLEVVYVCDNDYAGESALQQVSRHYGLALKGVMFGKDFPMSWDMADPMPKGMFAHNGRFIGTPLRKLIKPATRATELVMPEGGKGRPTAVLRHAFKEEWIHAIKPEVFIHKDYPSEILTGGEFNNQVAPYSDVDDTARLLKKDAASKSAKLRYDPGKEPGVYGDDGRYVNTHVPAVIKEEPDSEEEWDGEIARPWIDFMERLIPVEGDRKELLRWCATLIARPEIKMHYGVLLISETQGIGKGTLGEKILAPLMGADNVSYPTENEIVESNFNYWLAHKRLGVVHEIYAGHSAKAYNKLKSTITDKYITVAKKYMADYVIENWMHIFACSNSLRAIQLSGDDRRWFVPKVTEEKQEPEYWLELNKWLIESNGLGIIKRWAREWLEVEAPVLRGNDAPWSSAKAAVVEEGYSPGMTLVAGFLDKVKKEIENDGTWIDKNTKPEKANGKWKGRGIAMYDIALVQAIKNQLYAGRPTDKLERPLTIRKVAKQRGWHIHPEHSCVDGSVHGRLICSENEMTHKPLDDLLKETKPLEVAKLAALWFPM